MTAIIMLHSQSDSGRMPRRQLVLIAIGCLILSSCRSLPHEAGSSPTIAEPAANRMGTEHNLQDQPPIPTASVWATQPPAAVMQVGYHEVSSPVPHIIGHSCPHCTPGEAFDASASVDQWRPPGIGGPWPTDEYVCDGGDRAQTVHVAQNWNVGGIDPEDTVVHYDTLDGKTRVQPSNRVCIYAPRFAAVRQVSGAILNEQHQLTAGVETPQLPVSQELRLAANNVNQPIQAERNMGVAPVQALLDRNLAAGVEDVKFLMGIDYPLLPYEDLAIIRRGEFEASEKARLAEVTTAAKTWTATEGLQVILEGLAAHEAKNAEPAGEVAEYHMPKGKPRVRIVKVASKDNALPGDTIHFTLRFDNIGDQPIGNVTILDNLTPRLEYVPDSAKCSVDADFFTVDQDGESLVLRWELKQPLDVNEGGVIRFECRMR